MHRSPNRSGSCGQRRRSYWRSCRNQRLSAIGTSSATAVVGAADSSALQRKPNQQQQQVSAPEQPPQATQAHDYQAQLKRNALAASGPDAGSRSTLLTGSQGVSSSTLNLGGNTLLGL